MLKTNSNQKNIPVWITAVNVIVIFILFFQIFSCFVNPSWAYGAFENTDANRQAILTLAGRNLVMIAVTLLAMRSNNAALLALIFVMNFVRELYDMILVGYLSHFSLKGFGMMATFLVFLVPYVFAYKKLRQLASSTAKYIS